jgi:hypothetical protein
MDFGGTRDLICGNAGVCYRRAQNPVRGRIGIAHWCRAWPGDISPMWSAATLRQSKLQRPLWLGGLLLQIQAPDPNSPPLQISLKLI